MFFYNLFLEFSKEMPSKERTRKELDRLRKRGECVQFQTPISTRGLKKNNNSKGAGRHISNSSQDLNDTNESGIEASQDQSPSGINLIFLFANNFLEINSLRRTSLSGQKRHVSEHESIMNTPRRSELTAKMKKVKVRSDSDCFTDSTTPSTSRQIFDVSGYTI